MLEGKRRQTSKLCLSPFPRNFYLPVIMENRVPLDRWIDLKMRIQRHPVSVVVNKSSIIILNACRKYLVVWI